MISQRTNKLGKKQNMDRSELEITCHYSNSRAQGGSCAAYNIKPSIDWTQAPNQSPP